MQYKEYVKILDEARTRHLKFTTMDDYATYVPESSQNHQGNDLTYWVAVVSKETTIREANTKEKYGH